MEKQFFDVIEIINMSYCIEVEMIKRPQELITNYNSQSIKNKSNQQSGGMNDHNVTTKKAAHKK